MSLEYLKWVGVKDLKLRYHVVGMSDHIGFRDMGFGLVLKVTRIWVYSK